MNILVDKCYFAKFGLIALNIYSDFLLNFILLIKNCIAVTYEYDIATDMPMFVVTNMTGYSLKYKKHVLWVQVFVNES